MNKFLIEGLDRLGKDTLIKNIKHKRGYHHVMHFSKPMVLDAYTKGRSPMVDADTVKRDALHAYQEQSFHTMFSILQDANRANIICNRAHLGECVYAPLYRGYDGKYVFELEQTYMSQVFNARLILLVEDFETSKHFVDDGESFDITKRKEEQEMFISAFNQSRIPDKRIVCVTDKRTGKFKPELQIMGEVL